MIVLRFSSDQKISTPALTLLNAGVFILETQADMSRKNWGTAKISGRIQGIFDTGNFWIREFLNVGEFLNCPARLGR
jgi:hypothetical protein